MQGSLAPVNGNNIKIIYTLGVDVVILDDFLCVMVAKVMGPEVLVLILVSLIVADSWISFNSFISFSKSTINKRN